MFKWLRRKRLSADARRRLLLIRARSEEAVIDTHVLNALYLLESLREEVDPKRAIELYSEMMSLPEPVTEIVANRLLARLSGRSPAERRQDGRFRDVSRES